MEYKVIEHVCERVEWFVCCYPNIDSANEFRVSTRTQDTAVQAIAEDCDKENGPMIHITDRKIAKPGVQTFA